MAVTVGDIYSLNQDKNLEILTGNSSLERVVTGISLLDYEFSDKDLETIKDKVIISSFVFAKDDYKKVHDVICSLADNGAAVLGIKNVYCRTLKQETVDYAKSKNLSIFTFGHDVYYENIITDVHKMLKGANNSGRLTEQRVNSLVAWGRDTEELREQILGINSFFNEKHLVVYLKAKDATALKEDIALIEKAQNSRMILKQDSIFKFRKGLMYIATAKEVIKETPQESLNCIKILLSNLGIDMQKHFAGISGMATSMDFIDITMNESLYAVKFCELKQEDVVFFDEMDIYRIAFPLIDSPWGRRYYTNVIERIKEYDTEHNTDLMDTAIAYIDNEGNIKRTSELTFQHENTIRYKVKKIKEIIGVYDEGDKVYTELHIAMIMNELLKSKF